MLYSRVVRTLIRASMVILGPTLFLAAASCGDDEETTPSPSAAPTGVVNGTRTATPGGGASPTDEPFSGARTPVQVAGTPNIIQAHLKEVRAAKHSTFDRFTLEFDIVPPGYKVEYVEPPILADPSGKEVAIDGKAFLQITMQGAVANYLAAGGPPYTGPNELKPGLPNLVEAELTGDFEAVLIWVLGVNEEVDFRVLTLESPARLVVDVGHS
jgi:hypothetical protein